MKDKKENLTGWKFGRLEVVSFSCIRSGKTIWRCRCECGKEIEKRADSLKAGEAMSCGCLRREKLLEYEDLTDRKFGNLTVLKISKKRGNQGQIKWICLCDCGGMAITTRGSLLSGHAKSCGCLHRKAAAMQAMKMGRANKTHGCSKTREYQIWNHIHQRCNGTADEKSNQQYHKRGIRVCERWSKFQNFLEDMGKKPGPEYQIDRYPDINGNYEPGNCRWATTKEQQRNRRSNVPITYKGKTQCIAAWAEEYGLTTLQLWTRLRKMNWPVHEALTMPIAKNATEKRRYGRLYKNKGKLIG